MIVHQIRPFCLKPAYDGFMLIYDTIFTKVWFQMFIHRADFKTPKFPSTPLPRPSSNCLSVRRSQSVSQTVWLPVSLTIWLCLTVLSAPQTPQMRVYWFVQTQIQTVCLFVWSFVFVCLSVFLQDMKQFDTFQEWTDGYVRFIYSGENVSHDWHRHDTKWYLTIMLKVLLPHSTSKFAGNCC